MKKRTCIGLICIALALFLCFAVAPAVNKKAAETAAVCCASKTVAGGSEMTDRLVEIKDLPKSAVPAGAVTDPAALNGRFAASVIYEGDVITAEKLCAGASNADTALMNLSPGEYAVSITVDSFSAALSGKLKNGDIVSVFVKSGRESHVFVPEELRYVKVITCTSSQGVDCTDPEAEKGFSPSAVTLCLSPLQAEKIIEYESDSIHLALCARAGTSSAASLLERQADVLNALSAVK